MVRCFVVFSIVLVMWYGCLMCNWVVLFVILVVYFVEFGYWLFGFNSNRVSYRMCYFGLRLDNWVVFYCLDCCVYWLLFIVCWFVVFMLVWLDCVDLRWRFVFCFVLDLVFRLWFGFVWFLCFDCWYLIVILCLYKVVCYWVILVGCVFNVCLVWILLVVDLVFLVVWCFEYRERLWCYLYCLDRKCYLLVLCWRVGFGFW